MMGEFDAIRPYDDSEVPAVLARLLGDKAFLDILTRFRQHGAVINRRINHLRREVQQPRELPPRDRLAGVYFAATEHDEDQPIHLHVADTNVCVTKCSVEYGNPCTRFCPAGVYEIVNDTKPDGSSGKRLQINAANCVHCKTCDIKDPYQIINWVTPEGGSGPNYQNL